MRAVIIEWYSPGSSRLRFSGLLGQLETLSFCVWPSPRHWLQNRWQQWVEKLWGLCLKTFPQLLLDIVYRGKAWRVHKSELASFLDLCPIIHHGFQKTHIHSWGVLHPLQPPRALSPGNQDCCGINCFAYDNPLFWCPPLGVMSWDSTCGCCSFSFL